MTTEEKFNQWIERPLAILRESGDCAFAALAICFGLYERFIDSQLYLAGVKANRKAFDPAGAADLGCTEEAFTRFWDGYRMGLQHAFQPAAYVQDEGTGDSWGSRPWVH